MRDAGDANPFGTLLAKSANCRVVNNDYACSADYPPRPKNSEQRILLSA